VTKIYYCWNNFLSCCAFYRASDNWKTLKELEKAIKVYWDAKDRLPPRVCRKPSLVAVLT